MNILRPYKRRFEMLNFQTRLFSPTFHFKKLLLRKDFLAKMNLACLIFVLSVLSLISADDHDEHPQLKVRTSSGIIVGRYNENELVKEFLGVPYGVPPTGKLRFQVPLPINNAERTLKTQAFAPICIQPPHIKSTLNPLLRFNQTSMSEDCLYLNLYVPAVVREDSLPMPVLVFLSGEGFSYADPTQFDGVYFAATNNVIVVTVSYRVSVFGFLNALNKEAPGNVGLLDQRLALKWVKENIKGFGGDGNRITLAGRFTGAMSAAIHAFSPMSLTESLFQRIILFSGVPDGKWIVDSSPLNSVTELAEIAGCVYGNLDTTLTCLKNMSAESLLKHAMTIENPWRPSLDFHLIDDANILKGHFSPLDTLLFTNNNEGSLCFTILKLLHKHLYEKFLNNSVTKAELEKLMASFLLDVYKQPNDLANKLVSYVYAENEKDRKVQFEEFCGNLYVKGISYKLADILADKHANVFVAELVHRPSFSNQPSFIKAAHGDNVLYSLGLPLQIPHLPQTEILLTKEIMRGMTNFIYFGKPNPASDMLWPVYSNDSKLVKLFGAHSKTDIVRTPYEDSVAFWESIIPAAYQDHCPSMALSSALTSIEDDKHPSHVTFLGTWVSVSAAEYIMNGLICMLGLLLFSLLLSLAIILRQSYSTTFQRLK